MVLLDLGVDLSCPHTVRRPGGPVLTSADLAASAELAASEVSSGRGGKPRSSCRPGPVIAAT